MEMEDNMLTTLIECIHEFKTQKEYEGKDFEVDLIRLYGEVRKMLATRFSPEDFGPVSLTTIDDNLNTIERAKARSQIEMERKQIKLGYERIKEEIKTIRQDYRKVVTEGRRSGSGKLRSATTETS